jgi:hypothetical protein
MKSAIFLLLRLICYPALLVGLAAGLALLVIFVNGECSPPIAMAVTCTTKFSQALGEFGLAVSVFALETGVPIVLAAGGLIFLLRDLRRWGRSA